MSWRSLQCLLQSSRMLCAKAWPQHLHHRTHSPHTSYALTPTRPSRFARMSQYHHLPQLSDVFKDFFTKMNMRRKSSYQPSAPKPKGGPIIKRAATIAGKPRPGQARMVADQSSLAAAGKPHATPVQHPPPPSLKKVEVAPHLFFKNLEVGRPSLFKKVEVAYPTSFKHGA